MSADVLQDPRIGVTHNRAICCECGEVRTFSNGHSPRNRIYEARTDLPLRNGAEPYWRWMGDLKCIACDMATRHALLRDCNDERARNYAEEDNQPPAVLLEALSENLALATEIRRLQGFGVIIDYAREVLENDVFYYQIEQFDHDLSFRITLNSALTAPIMRRALYWAWRDISDAERCEAIDWDKAAFGRRIHYSISESGFEMFGRDALAGIDQWVHLFQVRGDTAAEN